MGEERMALEGLDHCHNAIVATNPEVVALGDVMGEDDSGALANSGEDGEQNSALQGLGLIDYDKGIVERATSPTTSHNATTFGLVVTMALWQWSSPSRAIHSSLMSP